MVIYLDGADLKTMEELSDKVEGFTTNPSLCRKAGVKNYKEFAREALKIAQGKPISFEVFSDDFREMEKQAREINSWGPNIFVKIPVTNSSGHFTGPVIERLRGLRLNVTAVMTVDQFNLVDDVLEDGIISIFAGRIADTGVDPTTILDVRSCLNKILWASAREVLNVKQAEACGCDIITLSPELVRKLDLFGKDLEEYSLETVRQFKKDSEGITF